MPEIKRLAAKRREADRQARFRGNMRFDRSLSRRAVLRVASWKTSLVGQKLPSPLIAEAAVHARSGPSGRESPDDSRVPISQERPALQDGRYMGDRVRFYNQGFGRWIWC